jgi:hypothetical protein
MKCKYCNSNTHTIKDCNSRVSIMLFSHVSSIMFTNPINFRYQIQELKVLRQSDLSMVCKKLHQPISGNKSELIFRILKEFFYLSYERVPTEQARLEMIMSIHTSYTDLLETIYIDRPIVINLIQMIDTWYWYTYGLMRNGQPLSEYRDELQEFYLTINMSNALLQTLDNTRNKLTKIAIKFEPLKQNKEDKEEEDEECAICYEDTCKTAQLGCGHKFCANCICEVAKATTKSFILCALCRDEITEIKVSDEDTKKQLELYIE